MIRENASAQAATRVLMESVEKVDNPVWGRGFGVLHFRHEVFDRAQSLSY